jgi:uncharacterized protein YecT (DUF1311 family)
MTAHELDQPRMIYTGDMPPHLMMRPLDPYADEEEEAAEEDDFEPGVEAPRPVLPTLLATGAALAAGIAIGVFAPALYRGMSASPSRQPVLQRAVVAPEPVAPSEPAPGPSLPKSRVAEAAPPPAVKTHPPAAPLRLAVARRAPKTAAAWRPTRQSDKACRPYACPDPEITAAEGDLQQAYQRALRAGAPADQLRAGQVEWLLARQAAANHSPADLPGIYRQRIAQLNALADDEPPH